MRAYNYLMHYNAFIVSKKLSAVQLYTLKHLLDSYRLLNTSLKTVTRAARAASDESDERVELVPVEKEVSLIKNQRLHLLEGKCPCHYGQTLHLLGSKEGKCPCY